MKCRNDSKALPNFTATPKPRSPSHGLNPYSETVFVGTLCVGGPQSGKKRAIRREIPATSRERLRHVTVGWVSQAVALVFAIEPLARNVVLQDRSARSRNRCHSQALRPEKQYNALPADR